MNFILIIAPVIITLSAVIYFFKSDMFKSVRIWLKIEMDN